eukprot:1777698-Pleurochrysis_carterae.AAC.1
MGMAGRVEDRGRACVSAVSDGELEGNRKGGARWWSECERVCMRGEGKAEERQQKREERTKGERRNAGKDREMC